VRAVTPRQPRIEYEGAICHVMNRRDRRGAMGRGEEDRRRFVSTANPAARIAREFATSARSEPCLPDCPLSRNRNRNRNPAEVAAEVLAAVGKWASPGRRNWLNGPPPDRASLAQMDIRNAVSAAFARNARRHCYPPKSSHAEQIFALNVGKLRVES
jgi:hypothetical protein